MKSGVIKMNTERQPLLRGDLVGGVPNDLEHGRTAARPDVRNSPDTGLVDVQSDESRKFCNENPLIWQQTNVIFLIF